MSQLIGFSLLWMALSVSWIAWNVAEMQMGMVDQAVEKQSGAVHPTVHFSDEQIKAMVEYVQQMTEEMEK